MSDNIHAFDGSLKSTAAVVKANMKEFVLNEWDHCKYPTAFSRNPFRVDIQLLNDNKLENQTLADCLLMPQLKSSAYIRIPSSRHPLEWLTSEEHEPIDNAWNLLRLAQNDQVVVIVPLLDTLRYARTKYYKPVELVGLVISTTRFAIALELIAPGVYEFMRSLLMSTDVVKVFANCNYEANQLHKVFGVPLQQAFCMSTALRSMLAKLEIEDAGDDNMMMPNFGKYTGIRLPAVSIYEDWKKPRILNFVEAMFSNVYFLLRFRRHPDNAFSLYQFGFNWMRSPTLCGIFHHLPEWFDRELWSEILTEKDNVKSLPIFVAAALYCCHPSLKLLEPQWAQNRFNALEVYSVLAQLSVDAVEPYAVESYEDEGLAILQCFSNWIAFESTDACIVKYPLISPVLHKLKYHAPLFCDFVDRGF